MTKISEMSIEARLDEEQKALKLPPKPPTIDKTCYNVIVGGLPIVPAGKVETLKKYLKNKLKFDDIEIPLDSDNQTKGIAFASYTNTESAIFTYRNFDGAAFDKSHKFKMLLLKDFEEIMKNNVEWKEPDALQFKYRNDMLSWQLQRQCRDQLLVHSKNEVIVFEHSNKSLELKWNRSDFMDAIVIWSPLGTYMATIHDKGVILWGGEKFPQINRFVHTKVRHISFSPNEKYIITYSLTNFIYTVNVWDVLTSRLIREFTLPKVDEEEVNNTTASGTAKTNTSINQFWPDFRWSYDDFYFARKQKDKISIYQSETCTMVDKKSLEIPGIRDFSWSSRGHLISYWVGEQESTPARIVLISVPEKKEIFTKTLFNVADIDLKWSSNDDYLAVIGERYGKKKKVEGKYIGLSASLEIYRIKEREIPVEKITINEKTQIIAGEWESNGTRFAVLTTNQKSYSLLIHDLKIVGQTQRVMETAFSTRVSVLRWSPSGQFLACSSPGSNTIDFIDGHEGAVLKRVEANHSFNEFVWDPTGRYLMAYRLNLLNDNIECTVCFYSITGRLLFEKNFPGLKQILWRPRMPCLLTEQEIKNIKKNMGKYNQQFAHQDEMMSNESKRKLMEDRQRLMQEWMSVRARVNLLYNNEKSARIELRKVDTDNLELGKCQEQTYVLVSSKIEVLSH